MWRDRLTTILTGIALVVGAWLLTTSTIPLPNVAPLLEAQGQGLSVSAANPLAYWVGPGACNSAVSANPTGTQGLTVAGTSNMPVVQAETSGAGTNTHTYICNIAPPYAIISTINTGFAIQDAVFFYAVPLGGPLDTQTATLPSGTMNSTTVFGQVVYPAPGVGETPSTVAPARADTGSMAIAPVVASFNVTTTTAGSFFSARFTPGAPIIWRTDLRQLLLQVTLNTVTLTATRTNSPGVLVHYRSN
jgi:hypothetical protein